MSGEDTMVSRSHLADWQTWQDWLDTVAQKVYVRGVDMSQANQPRWIKDLTILVNLPSQITPGDHQSLEPKSPQSADRQGSQFLMLPQPVLVRLTLQRNDEKIRVLCRGTEVKRSAVRVALPSRLNLEKGCKLRIELFIRPGEAPVSIWGTVCSIYQGGPDDIRRYFAEIEFEHIKRESAKQLEELMRTNEQRRGLPA